MVLEFGKLEMYPSPLIENLVREGNIGRDNPNHFWNALFSAFREYRDKTFKEKMSYIKTERKRIASNIQIKDWVHYGNGFQANHLIYEEFRRAFIEFEKDSPNPLTAILMKIIQDKEHFMDKLNVSDYQLDMRDLIVSKMTNNFMQRLDATEHKEGKRIPKEKRDKCLNLFKQHIESLWTRCAQKTFEKFIHDLEDTETSISFYLIPFILGYLDFHVFFVDARTQHVLCINEHYENVLKIPKEECLLILYDSKTQLFETLGVIDPNDDDDEHKTVCLSRIFETDDPIAQICYKSVVETH